MIGKNANSNLSQVHKPEENQLNIPLIAPKINVLPIVQTQSTGSVT